MKKNRILTAAVALCLVAIMACGSLAYFTSTKTVVNTFKTSTIPMPDENGDGIPDREPTAEDVFSIALYEDGMTVVGTDDAGNNIYGKIYEEMLPSSKLDKDPTVQNTGAYDAYVRMNVTVSCAGAWQAAIVKHFADASGSIADFDLTTIFGEFNTDWISEEVIPNTEDDTLTYVFYLNKALEPNATSTLFESVTIPAEFDAEDMLSLKEFTLTVTADAIQTANTGDTAQEAFADYWE